MARPVFVLGSGINAMWIARSLGKRSIPVYVFNQKLEDIAYHSRYVTACEYWDDSNAPDVIGQLKQAAGRLNARPIVLIVTDRFLEIVSDNKDEILGLPPGHDWCRCSAYAANARKREVGVVEVGHWSVSAVLESW